jgi:pimeloyl-ACP methyl ester carboxylesterase
LRFDRPACSFCSVSVLSELHARRIYLDRIWNDFTGSTDKPDEATRAYYAAQYAQPRAMRAGFAQFTAFAQDAEDNKIFQQAKLTMPVLAIGGEKSFGATEAAAMRNLVTPA